ncbi:MAG: cation:proton antiporter [Alphaproteobacteria bacterium]|nr:cation:proton antiporter [Alphaproteobacteria bacterium]
MSLVQDTVLFLGSAVIVVPIVKRFGFGAVLGYLAAGLMIGPSILGLVSDVDAILHFGEFGVVLLLFIIGLELQPARLWSLRRPVFGLGFAQMALSALLIGLAAFALGLSPQAAAIVGLVLALSSTAFAIQTLAERNNLRTQHGRAAFSILLFQDLAVIPLLAVIPWLVADYTLPDGETANVMSDTDWLSILFSIFMVGAVTFGGRYVLRPLLRLTAAAGITELFTAAALLVVLGMALLMETIGLSLALGAFLAGVLLADTQYRHRLEADINPFKGLLLGLFFIAVGMSVDLARLVEQPLAVFGAAIGLMLIKVVVLLPLGRMARLRFEQTLALAAVLPQGGEFAFVLFSAAVNAGAVDRATVDFLILVVVVSMVLTPVSVTIADRLRRMLARQRAPDASVPDIGEHEPRVIIAGFGRFGQIVGRLLNLRRIKFVALDSDDARIAVARQFGNEAYFGDANRLQILEAAGTARAEAFVIAVDDAERAIEIAQMVRMHFPSVTLYARASDRFHAYRLLEVGVSHVFREMFGSSLDLSRELIHGLGVPAREADILTRRFREHDEKLLHEQYLQDHDAATMVRTTKEAAEHLMGLFELDRISADDEASKDDASGPAPLTGDTDRRPAAE